MSPAIGQQTTVVASFGPERFRSKGLMITEKNYLDVYPYDRWVEQSMPYFQRDQRVQPTELKMREGKTEPPSLLTESDLISLMDMHGIGTDATIAQHIKTILDRGYARNEGHVFHATPLGLGLVEGYDALDFHMSQPTLRAHMEVCSLGAQSSFDFTFLFAMLISFRLFTFLQRELGLVSRGLKAGATVVQETLLEMKRVYEAVEQRANVLEQHLEQYFTPAMAQRGLQMVEQGFMQCSCGGRTDLKQSTSGPYPQRSLYCAACNRSLSIPGKHAIRPYEHLCPICQHQVLEVRNEEKNTTHTLCPYCFNNPPQQDIEDAASGAAVSGGFRCFQCTKADCALSNKSVEADIERVRPEWCV
jgi:DNA topoisomerase-3